MIEVKRVKRKGVPMEYNIKDAIERIDIYSQRNLSAKAMTQHDKQIISGHILPLIIEKKTLPHTEKSVERTQDMKQDPSDMGENQSD